jgi:hypothetical protein
MNAEDADSAAWLARVVLDVLASTAALLDDPVHQRAPWR